MAIKFNRHHVTDGTTKARVFYSLDNRGDQRPCVTLYARDYGHALGKVLGGAYVNDTDSQTDYFDKGRAVLFADHPLYKAARDRAESINAERAAKYSGAANFRAEVAAAVQA